jgi:hypothetical protein
MEQDCQRIGKPPNLTHGQKPFQNFDQAGIPIEKKPVVKE